MELQQTIEQAASQETPQGSPSNSSCLLCSPFDYPAYQVGCRETATFDFLTPVDCTKEQLEEWLRFQLGAIGGISVDNPLAEHDLSADGVSLDT